jgi:hypothetical protein
LAAVFIAVPAFQRYKRRSQTTEAMMNLRRLYDNAVGYYQMQHANSRGDVVSDRFPESVPLTPSQIPCGEKAPVVRSDWAHPTWEALTFQPLDAMRYSYQFDSSGIGPTATFTAAAFGDLDCDGVYSTFVRIGSVDARNEVRGGPGLLVEDELE